MLRVRRKRVADGSAPPAKRTEAHIVREAYNYNCFAARVRYKHFNRYFEEHGYGSKLSDVNHALKDYLQTTLKPGRVYSLPGPTIDPVLMDVDQEVNDGELQNIES